MFKALIGYLAWIQPSNRKVFYGTALVAWSLQASHQYCCSIGMRLIEFDNYEQMKEFNQNFISLYTRITRKFLILAEIFYIKLYAACGCWTMISDTMTTGPTSEIWCGSKKEVNNSIRVLNGMAFPTPICEPQVYHMRIRDENFNPLPMLDLINVATPVSSGCYFACA